MQLILSHTGAGCDALAAMLAARRLYPEAYLALPGPLDAGQAGRLEQLGLDPHIFLAPEQLRPDELSLVVLVDTRRAAALGPLRVCLDQAGLSVHCYDWHAPLADDISAHEEGQLHAGATSSLVAAQVRQRGLACEPAEYTLLLLGIYEATGGFLHTNTRPLDFEIAAWLLTRGAELKQVARLRSGEAGRRPSEILDELNRNIHTFPIHGLSVAIARLDPGAYRGDLAMLAQDCMAANGLQALFILALVTGKLSLLCRSSVPEINAGAVARGFGGEGRAAQATATISAMGMDEAEERLLALLHAHIRPKTPAKGLMSTPVLAITPEMTIRQAADVMTRYNVSVLPVVRRGAQNGRPACGLLGTISRAVAEKCIHHALGEAPVADYMNAGLTTLGEEASIEDIRKLMLTRRLHLVPIVRGEELVGVITRSDLMGHIFGGADDATPDIQGEAGVSGRNLSTIMTRVLPQEILRLLRIIGEIAEHLHYQAFVVGGFVRDLLLNQKNMDIDVVVEGEGILFARELAARLGGEVHPHQKFNTATVILPEKTSIDVATARREYYESPAALPTVERGSIKFDLARRDFTVNAMAIRLNPDNFGMLVDYFNSQSDLVERRIQVLHNLSFVEDPTRIFRAIRFETRLGFHLTRLSENLIRNAVRLGLPGRVEGSRLLHELRLIFNEDDPALALRRMLDFQLQTFLWPGQKGAPRIDQRLLRVLSQARQAVLLWQRLSSPQEKAAFEQWRLYMLAIMHRADLEEFCAFCRRLGLPESRLQQLAQQKKDAEQGEELLSSQPSLRPSEIYRMMREFTPEGLLYLFAIARDSSGQDAVTLYLTRLRQVKPLLGGRRLVAMGYRPGPRFGAIHQDLLTRQLDGLIHNEAEAEAFIRQQYPLS